MANPNFAACMTMIANACNLLDKLEDYTSTATTGVIDTAETLRNDLEGDYGQAVRDGISRTLAEIATPLSAAGARRLINPLIRQAAVAIDYPNPGAPISVLWEALVDYMVANSQTINDQEDTIDTTWSAGGGNVGDSSVFTITLDENGEILGHMTDAWTLECIDDARTIGSTGKERWELSGTTRRSDNLDYTGTGLTVSGLRTASADLSKRFVRNPSFNDYREDGSSQLTSLPGWTQQTGANLYTNLSINSTYYHRVTPGDGVNVGLQFNGDETIVQDLVDVAGARIDQDVPYVIAIAVAKVGTPTGTFTLRLSGTTGSGGVANTLAHAAMTGSGTFDILQITGDANQWPSSWNANDLKLQVSLASSGSIDASNYFVVSDILFMPYDRVASMGDARTGRGSMGRWVKVIGGATPAVRGDTHTATDTLGATRGTIHWGLTKIANYGCLPLQTGGTETVSDI